MRTRLRSHAYACTRLCATCDATRDATRRDATRRDSTRRDVTRDARRHITRRDAIPDARRETRDARQARDVKQYKSRDARYSTRRHATLDAAQRDTRRDATHRDTPRGTRRNAPRHSTCDARRRWRDTQGDARPRPARQRVCPYARLHLRLRRSARGLARPEICVNAAARAGWRDAARRVATWTQSCLRRGARRVAREP